jgi:hypothetical protein
MMLCFRTSAPSCVHAHNSVDFSVQHSGTVRPYDSEECDVPLQHKCLSSCNRVTGREQHKNQTPLHRPCGPVHNWRGQINISIRVAPALPLVDACGRNWGRRCAPNSHEWAQSSCALAGVGQRCAHGHWAALHLCASQSSPRCLLNVVASLLRRIHSTPVRKEQQCTPIDGLLVHAYNINRS